MFLDVGSKFGFFVKIFCVWLVKTLKGRTIRKVMAGGGGGGGEKAKKKFMQGKMPRKKIRAKKKGKKKIHAEGRSNCDFYLIYNICQQAC